MRINRIKNIIVAIFLILLATIPTVYAKWIYTKPLPSESDNLPFNLMEFSYDPGEILYISNVERISSTSFQRELEYGHSLPTNVKLTGNVTSKNCTATYKITVFNNTDVTYWFIGTEIKNSNPSGNFSASSISLTLRDTLGDSANSFNTQDWIPPRTYRDFYVTYSFNNGYTDVTCLVNYYFSIKMDSVKDEFLKILNDKESAYGYNYLAGTFNQNYSENKSTVLTNVGSDLQVFNNMFGKTLTVNVNGTEVPVTVTIERKNVDGRTTGDAYQGSNAPTGCEYTLYITTDALTSGGTATVYAVSYTCGADGTWYQLGQLYEGTAKSEDYETTAGYQGSVDTETWIATKKTYTIADNIYYKVNEQYGTNFDQLKTIDGIQSTNDTEIFNKIDNSNILKKIYDILNKSENKYSTAEEVVLLRTAFEDMAPYYNNYNNGQEFKIKRNCPRAEIIPYIIRLNDAWSYYNQFH